MKRKRKPASHTATARLGIDEKMRLDLWQEQTGWSEGAVLRQMIVVADLARRNATAAVDHFRAYYTAAAEKRRILKAAAAQPLHDPTAPPAPAIAAAQQARKGN